MTPNSEKTALLVGLAREVLRLPFQQMMALVLTLAMISVAVYEIGWGRKELINQIHTGQADARNQFDATIQRTVDQVAKSNEKTVEQLTKANEREVESIKQMVRDLVGSLRLPPHIGRAAPPHEKEEGLTN